MIGGLPCPRYQTVQAAARGIRLPGAAAAGAGAAAVPVQPARRAVVIGTKVSVQCKNCHAPMSVVTIGAPCRNCGTPVRDLHVRIEDTVKLDEGVEITARRRGPKPPGTKKRPFMQSRNRTETFRQDGDRRRVQRVFDGTDPDPSKWRYRELITDAKTGAIIKNVDGPLDEHQGFGSAKRQSPRKKG